MIYDRETFITRVTNDLGSNSNDDALFIPEREPDFGTPCECQFFLKSRGVNWDNEKRHFWAWVHAYMAGEVRVFAASKDGDWFGFTDYHDAFQFALTW
jgi:hypothetical protein